MILQRCSCYYSLHKWGLNPSNFEMLGIFIYVHFYQVHLNISNLLEVVLMHKHCPNHFCILGFKMSIVVLIDKSCKLCSKSVFNPNFYSHKFKKMFFTYSNGNEPHVPISYYIALFDFWTFNFDFCLTFSWNFCVMLHMNMSLCLLYASLIFDHFYDIKYMFRICAHIIWEYALNVWNFQFPKS